MSTESAILERDRPPRWRAAFLEGLRTLGCVSAACRLAEVGRQTVYDHRTADEGFAKAWDEALDESADLLVLEARRRAHDGVDEPVIWQGQLTGVWVGPDGTVVTETTPNARRVPLTVRKYSDALLMFLIKARRPEYRDSFRVQHAGDAAQPVKVEHGGKVEHDHVLTLTRNDLDAACRLAGVAGGDVHPHGGPQPVDPARGQAP